MVVFEQQGFKGYIMKILLKVQHLFPQFAFNLESMPEFLERCPFLVLASAVFRPIFNVMDTGRWRVADGWMLWPVLWL